MSIRSAMALNVAPLALRLALGLTFVWAGIGKVAHSATITDPAELALLSEWGQIDPVPGALPPEADDNEVVEETPEPNLEAPQDDDTIEPEPADPTESAPEDGGEEASETVSEDEEVMPVAFLQGDRPVSVKRVMKLAIMIHNAANPGVDDAGQAKMALWPEPLAKGNLPVVFAWVAAITELVCGAALLTGFFTRIASIPIVGTMVVAMWLTQIGPALQSGATTFGFLPAGMYEIGAGGYVWTHLFWQFALATMGIALFFLGAGALSIDRLIFGSPEGASGAESRQVEFVPMNDA